MDAVEIGDGRWLAAAGYESGSVALWRTLAEHDPLVDGHPAGLERLWERETHAGPVTDVRVSRTHIVSGSMTDRTIYVYTLANDWPTGTPLALHRTFECEGMMTGGVRDVHARSMLESLRSSQEQSG